VAKLVDDIREGQGFGQCKYAYIIPGFTVLDSQKSQSFVELGLLERTSDPYHSQDIPLPLFFASTVSALHRNIHIWNTSHPLLVNYYC